MSAKVELLLRGAMDHLRIAWQTGETLLASIPFEEDPEGTRYNVLLAIQEMVTNILRHGYRGDEQQPVAVHFEVDGDGMTVTLRDQGPAFDPTASTPEPAGEEFPESEGGYGIMIARMVMDELDYRRDGEWNVLSMTKHTRVTAQQG